jgi:hypothetical protein
MNSDWVTTSAAITDEDLLAPSFAGESWATWRAVLRAAEGLPLDEGQLDLFRGVAERDPPEGRVRELWAIAGRRSGKDSIASAIATAAAMGDYRSFLRPGERATVMCLAVDRQQAKIVHRYIGANFQTNSMLARLVEHETDDGIELRTGVEIIVATNSYRATRGRTVVCAIFDETAFWRSEDAANPDLEVYAAVLPSMVTMPGAMLVGISTPYRRSGLLFDRWRTSYGKPDNDVLVVKGPSTAFNPLLPLSVITAALERDPEAAGAEWLAEWRSDLADFVSREVVDAVTVPGRFELPPVSGVVYMGFCDPSGGSSDSMTLAIGHEQDGIAILDAVREVRAPFKPSDVTAEFAALLKSYRLRDVVGDKYGGAWPADAFLEHGISYIAAEHSKSDIYRELLPAINGGMVELLDHPRLIAQLCALERRTARGGRDSIDHPPGGHDDVINAVAGVLLDLSGGDAPRESRGAYMFARQQAEGVPAEEIGAASALLDHPESSVPGQLDYASASYRSELSEGQKAIVRFAPGRHGTRQGHWRGCRRGPLVFLHITGQGRFSGRMVHWPSRRCSRARSSTNESCRRRSDEWGHVDVHSAAPRQGNRAVGRNRCRARHDDASRIVACQGELRTCLKSPDVNH